ncbi:MAG: hypothetical protein HQL76_10195 [Magnetococcales bacterium]|nr:hypothetical protein [Magnetococcales bacterium]
MIALKSPRTWSDVWCDRGRDVLLRATAGLTGISQTWGQKIAVALSWESLSRHRTLWVSRFNKIIKFDTDTSSDTLRQVSRVAVATYSSTGEIRASDFKQSPGRFAQAGEPGFQSRWPREPYHLNLSETARLANGIAIHATGPEGTKEKFIHHVQEVRRNGGYDHPVFQEARALLNRFHPSPDIQPDG